MMELNFDNGKNYLVTGASSGIGEATALKLNELGASVVAVARNKERLLSMKAKCKNPEKMHIEVKDLAQDMDGLPQFTSELLHKYTVWGGVAYVPA